MAFKPGLLRMGLVWKGTGMHAEHEVDPGQEEPGPVQAQTHKQDFLITDLQLAASYRVLDWLGLELFLPIALVDVEAEFTDVSGALLPGFVSIHHRTETIFGLGDMLIGARAAAVMPTPDLPLLVEFQVGTTLPTGHIEPNPFALGEEGKTHQHMFFGSGTFNPALGLNANYRFSDFSLGLWAASVFPVYSNSEGYRAPTTLGAGLNSRIPLGDSTVSLLVQAEFFREWPATWGDRAAKNSGRTDLVATLGVNWSPMDQWTTSLTAKVPYYTDADGGQLDIPVILQFAIHGQFQLLE